LAIKSGWSEHGVRSQTKRAMGSGLVESRDVVYDGPDLSVAS
jgi:hypothetical protein